MPWFKFISMAVYLSKIFYLDHFHLYQFFLMMFIFETTDSHKCGKLVGIHRDISFLISLRCVYVPNFTKAASQN